MIAAMPVHVLAVMPTVSATQLSVTAVATDAHVFVTLHLVGLTETFVRLPERRRAMAHRRLQAEHMTQVAGELSLPEFRRYLADCGFVLVP